MFIVLPVRAVRLRMIVVVEAQRLMRSLDHQAYWDGTHKEINFRTKTTTAQDGSNPAGETGTAQPPAGIRPEAT